MTDESAALRRLAIKRWRMAIALSAVVVVIYFGFILLIAFNKAAMRSLLTEGLSVGIVLGALVIVLTWATTWFYVHWTSRHIDAEIARLNGGQR